MLCNKDQLIEWIPEASKNPCHQLSHQSIREQQPMVKVMSKYIKAYEEQIFAVNFIQEKYQTKDICLRMFL